MEEAQEEKKYSKGSGKIGVYNFPLAPPLSSTTEPLSPLNSNLPGSLQISEDGQLLKSYIVYNGFTGDIISSYNNFINEEMPRQLAARPIRLPENLGYVVFSNRTFNPPKPMIASGAETTEMLPLMARRRNLTYSVNLFAQMTHYSPRGEILAQTDENHAVFLGKIPVMLGSVLCYLNGLSDEEKLKIGECPKDPLGYFIIKGIERIIFLQEKLRLNRYLIYANKEKGVICRFTSYTPKSTTLIDLSAGSSKSIRLSLHFLGKEKTIPVFLVFTLLLESLPQFQNIRGQSLQIALDLVLGFVEPRYKKKVTSLLASSFLEAGGIADPYTYLRKLEIRQTENEEILAALYEGLFPQMGGSIDKTTGPAGTVNKLQLLSLMIAQYALYLAGLRGVDDRDNVANKRFEAGGASVQQLFGALINKAATDIEARIGASTTSRQVNSDILSFIRQNYQSQIITDNFVSTFEPNKWGIKGSYAKDNVTDVLNRESPLHTYAQLTKINTPTRRQAKQPHIRMVQMSQLGFIDAIETPEGKAVGLIKHKAVGSYSTPADRDTVIILRCRQAGLLHDYFVPDVSPNACLVNGKFIGWTDGPEVRNFLVGLRRRREIPLYTSISLYSDRVLYVSTESSRLSRPLLVVEENISLYEKLGFSEGVYTFDDLLQAGVVEFIDAMEQDTLYIAQSLADLRSKRGQLLNLEEKLVQAQVARAKLGSLVTAEEKREVLPETQELEGIEITINRLALDETALEETFQRTIALADQAVSLAEGALKKFREGLGNYTHAELNPNSILSISASVLPLPGNNMGPRNMYTCGMMKQALGIYHSNHNLRFDPTIKMLATPTPPIFATQMNEWLGLDELPSGDTVIVALMPYYGFNQEDAFVFNKSSIERGLFSYLIYNTYTSTSQGNSNKEFRERFARPPPKHTSDNTLGTRRDIYHALDESGVAKLGVSVIAGDVLISKERVNREGGLPIYENVRLGIGEKGVVDRVMVDRNEEGQELVKVKIREIRLSSDPVVGDKFSSRYAQKGTIGLIVPQEDMPYDPKTGLTPDIIINPLCFVGETPVTLYNGLSRRIDSMAYDGGMKVWSWRSPQEEKQAGFVEAQQIELAPKGKQKVVKMTLQDGRTIRCTPGHKFLILKDDKHIWKPAEEILIKEDKVVIGLEGVLDDPSTEEREAEIVWSLPTCEYLLTMDTEENREKSMAFARILGVALSDGCIYSFVENSKAAFQCRINLGHPLDVQAIENDIFLLTGKHPKPLWDKTCWAINLPRPLARSMGQLEGITLGRRSKQEDSLPKFLLEENCPKSILREFLGGLFGGDGHAPVFIDQAKRSGASFISGVAFSQTIYKSLAESMEEKMRNIAAMLIRVGVTSVAFDKTRPVRYAESSYKPRDHVANPRVEVKIRLPADTSFSKYVGFRYCVQKQLRLCAATSYWRFQEEVKRQHDQVVAGAFALLEAKDKRVVNGKRIVKQKALDIAREELLDKETALNEHFSLSSVLELNNRQNYNRRRGSSDISLRNFDYNFIEDASAFLRKMDCLDWFKINQEKDNKYIVNKEMDYLPAFYLEVIDRRNDGIEEVYDISVAGTENFLAQGLTSHNCVPSRMTIGKLMEIVASKVGALRGERVNATAFNNFNIKDFEDNLIQYGYNRHGTEKLISGITGEPIEADIFIGPCYYMMLRHLVKNKIQIRSTNLYNPVSHQPVGGRMKGGGLRFGGMEKSALLSHGASGALIDSLMHRSDAYETIFCTRCSSIAIVSNKFDQPICSNRNCGGKKEFGRVSIPFAQRWLSNLLAGAGINVRFTFRKKDEPQI